MTLPLRVGSLQSYQVILYNRALHPELFPLRGRRVFRTREYELEAWVMPGGHLLRFERKGLCACELLTDQEKNPDSGVVTAFLCAGERDVEHQFLRDRVTYIATVQSETLTESLYASTFDEMRDFAAESEALAYGWRDDHGPCLSVVDVQSHRGEVHAQAYHMIAGGGIVVRTQTIFQCDDGRGSDK